MDRTIVTRNLPAWALAILGLVAPYLHDLTDVAVNGLFAWTDLPDDVESTGAAFLAAVVAFVLGYFGVQRGTVPVDPATAGDHPDPEDGALGVVEALLVVLVVVIILAVVGVL